MVATPSALRSTPQPPPTLLLLPLLLLCAATAAPTPTTTPLLSAAHSTLELSQARSDLGAAAAGGAAVFGGGCSGGSSSGGSLGGGCLSPSAVVDVLRPSRADPRVFEVSQSKSTGALSQGRGWATTCSFGPAQEWVAFFGGATKSAGSRTLDLYSATTGALRTNTAPIEGLGRWGTSCAPFGDGSHIVFAGGKHWPIMAKGVYVLPAPGPNASAPAPAMAVAPFSLSEAREDCGAVSYGAQGALFVGGWVSNREPGNPSVAVDAFDFDSSSPSHGHSAWPAGTLNAPGKLQEWVGAVAWNASTVFVADATTLYEVNTERQLQGLDPPTKRPLPAAVASAAGIPAARLQQNGVRVPGAVCFYASAPSSALVCWSPPSSAWQTLLCNETHVAGAITAVGNVVLVGGGYRADDKTVTAMVDVFAFSE